MISTKLTIRSERKKDFRAVEQLIREAFWNLYVPGCSEHFVMHNLRNGIDIIPELDLVAEKEGRVVGQVVYTRGILKTYHGEEIEVLSFGPISVLPEFQKQGIGGVLIKHTIDLATAMKYPAVCIYGDPRYYSRFGFRCAEKYDIKTSDDKYAVALLALELKKGALGGRAGRFIESRSYAVDENELAKYDAVFPFKEKAETASQQEFKLLVSLRY